MTRAVTADYRISSGHSALDRVADLLYRSRVRRISTAVVSTALALLWIYVAPNTLRGAPFLVVAIPALATLLAGTRIYLVSTGVGILAVALRILPHNELLVPLEALDRFRLTAMCGMTIVALLVVRWVESQRAAQRERTLRILESEQRLASVVAATPGVVYRYEKRGAEPGRFTFMSPYAKELLGVDPDAVLADTGALWKVIEPGDIPALRDAIDKAASDRTPFTAEFRVRHANGDVRWIGGRALPDAQGDRMVAFSGVYVDVTDRRLLEEELRQSQRLESLGRLAGGIAHDVNNVLTAIAAQAELLGDPGVTPGQARVHAEEISLAVRHGAALARQLLGFARRESVRMQVIDVDELVLRLEPLLRRLVGVDVILEINAGADGTCVRADPTYVEQVLVNLVVNARDATQRGDRIDLGTRTVDDTLLIEVRDTGHGMDEETRARAFDPFFSTKPVGRGTGLGLAICYSVIAEQGGRINIDSSPDRGTTVLVSLPIVRATADALPGLAHRLPATGRGTETLLVVDDDPIVRRATVTALRRFGYDVHEAADGDAAMQIVRNPAVSLALLVTDVVMPVQNGPELARDVLKVRPGLRCLFVSGYTAHEGGDIMDAVPDAQLLRKPYDASTLAARVRAVLDGT